VYAQMFVRKCRVRPMSKRGLTVPRFFTLIHDHRKPEPISDAEWEARTGESYLPVLPISSEGSYPYRIHLAGRTITVLTETLPQFFSTGLVLSVDRSKLPDIVDASQHGGLNGTGVRHVVEGVGSLVTGKGRTELGEDFETDELEVYGDIEPIYSSKVQLVYTPKGFERSLHMQGERTGNLPGVTLMNCTHRRTTVHNVVGIRTTHTQRPLLRPSSRLAQRPHNSSTTILPFQPHK
jgi:hypothetical protein